MPGHWLIIHARVTSIASSFACMHAPNLPGVRVLHHNAAATMPIRTGLVVIVQLLSCQMSFPVPVSGRSPLIVLPSQ